MSEWRYRWLKFVTGIQVGISTFFFGICDHPITLIPIALMIWGIAFPFFCEPKNVLWAFAPMLASVFIMMALVANKDRFHRRRSRRYEHYRKYPLEYSPPQVIAEDTSDPGRMRIKMKKHRPSGYKGSFDDFVA